MNVYTVHVKGSTDDQTALDSAVLVREGFVWGALLFGPLWLFWNRLWIAFFLCILVETGLYLLTGPILSGGTTAELLCIIHAALGFEAAQIRRKSLARRGYRLVDLVHGARMIDGERAFFQRALRNEKAVSTAPALFSRQQPAMVGLYPSVGG